ncbi:MAG: transposase [Pleurocapsa sp. SU_196_0]|nr:transposase [Pleurocapsa sp. SU_196_0]
MKNFDYTSSVAYFVTICTWQREESLGAVLCDETQPNALGKLVSNLWLEIPRHHPHVETDALVVMPNHLHGILTFVRRGLPRQTPVLAHAPAFGHRVPSSLGSVIGLFKSAVTKQAREITANPELRVWQKNYFERIIRDDRELNAVREYISANPANWSGDLETQTDLELHTVTFSKGRVLA